MTAPGPAKAHIASATGESTMVDVTTEEYRLFCIPIMLGVYTARHNQNPPSEDFLYKHIFGSERQAGCDECRAETELLIAHQKKSL